MSAGRHHRLPLKIANAHPRAKALETARSLHRVLAEILGAQLLEFAPDRIFFGVIGFRELNMGLFEHVAANPNWASTAHGQRECVAGARVDPTDFIADPDPDLREIGAVP